MLQELLWALYTAKTDNERSKALRNLEMVGMDRRTAIGLANEMSEEAWISFGFDPYGEE